MGTSDTNKPTETNVKEVADVQAEEPIAAEEQAVESQPADTQASETPSADEKTAENAPAAKSFMDKLKGWLGKNGFILMYVVVNLFRFILAATFLFSAFTKANDPVGFNIKLGDYAAALGLTGVPDFIFYLAGILLTLVEATLGIYLLVGVRRRRRTASLTVLFMAAMTAVTVWVAAKNPVTDCGCFGDALVLTNNQTLLKNIILLLMAVCITIYHKMMFRLIHKDWNWLITIPVVVFTALFFTYSAYMLPVVDFLPFAEGTDLRKTVSMGDGLELNYKVSFVYTNGTDTLVLSDQDDDPDSNVWRYVETRNELLSGNVEATTDFYVLDSDKDDVSFDILQSDGFVFLVTVPDITKASEACSGKFNTLYRYCEERGYGFYFITGGMNEEAVVRWADNTGAQYPFYESEDRMLWQVVRDNPGVVLLQDGVVLRKWSQFNMPDFNFDKELDLSMIEELPHARKYACKPIRLNQ